MYASAITWRRPFWPPLFFLSLLPLPPRPIAMPHAADTDRQSRAAHFTSTPIGRTDPDRPTTWRPPRRAPGLQFIILTDHGDGTRAPDPPQYRVGRSRHRRRRAQHRRRALHRDRPSAGAVSAARRSARRRRGRRAARRIRHRRASGFGEARPAVARLGCPVRRQWSGSTPTPSGATSGASQLARALAAISVPAGGDAGVAARSSGRDARSDGTRSTQRRRVVALAGADAHARAGWMDDERNGYRRGWFLRIPSYEASFRTFAMRVALDAPLAQRMQPPMPRAIIAALKTGRVYSAIDAHRLTGDARFLGDSGGRPWARARLTRRGGSVIVHRARRTRRPAASSCCERMAASDAAAAAGADVRDRRRRAPIESRCTSRTRRAIRRCRGSSAIRFTSARRMGSCRSARAGTRRDHARHSGRAVAHREGRRISGAMSRSRPPTGPVEFTLPARER